jgi:hypothetical protein
MSYNIDLLPSITYTYSIKQLLYISYKKMIDYYILRFYIIHHDLIVSLYPLLMNFYIIPRATPK